jgi:PPK2 family polyphosphate:nucleotide phosphotransferase
MIKLNEYPTIPDEKYSKKECRKELKSFQERLFELQNVFYADNRFSLLIVFQALDTAGKDGSIRHVMSCMNPMGVQVTPFKQPTVEELSHDFLWRVYPHFPSKGMIQVFNRSYYEDILVPSIQKKLSTEAINHRCELINRIEEHLQANETHVLKFFLHVSNDEQNKRIKERLTQPHKRWKYKENDSIVAKEWSDYMEVYNMIVNTCNKPDWHIIPADKRWYRNYAVAKVLTNYLESLHLKFPDSKSTN